MAGSKVNQATATDPNPENIIETQDTQRKGYLGLTLTNIRNSSAPAIAAGSNVEVAGALYAFDSQETISTTDPDTGSTVADGEVYIRVIPSGDSITAAFTATAPTWNDGFQGWYETSGGTATDRYIGGCHNKTSTAYEGKFMVSGKVGTLVKDFFVKTYVGARRATETNINTSAWRDITGYNTVEVDTEGEFNGTTGVFSPTISGYYRISFSCRVKDSTLNSTDYELVFYDGTINVDTTRGSKYNQNEYNSLSLQVVAELDSSKTYKMRIRLSTASGMNSSVDYGNLTIEKLSY